MTTTTIRLPEELKARVLEEAENRYARIIATGESVSWDDMKNYLKSRVANKETTLPKSHKLDLQIFCYIARPDTMCLKGRKCF